MTQHEQLTELIFNASKAINEDDWTCRELAAYLLHEGVVVLPPVCDMLFDAYLYETDKIIIEHYLNETEKGLL